MNPEMAQALGAIGDWTLVWTAYILTWVCLFGYGATLLARMYVFGSEESP